MLDELSWIRKLEQDVQALQSDLDSRPFGVSRARNKALGLRSTINRRIIDLLEEEVKDGEEQRAGQAVSNV